MINKHIPVMLDEVKSFIPKDKKLSVIDATFGGGGYSSSILEEFNVSELLAIDRDPISQIFAKKFNEEAVYDSKSNNIYYQQIVLLWFYLKLHQIQLLVQLDSKPQTIHQMQA